MIFKILRKGNDYFNQLKFLGLINRLIFMNFWL